MITWISYDFTKLYKSALWLYRKANKITLLFEDLCSSTNFAYYRFVVFSWCCLSPRNNEKTRKGNAITQQIGSRITRLYLFLMFLKLIFSNFVLSFYLLFVISGQKIAHYRVVVLSYFHPKNNEKTTNCKMSKLATIIPGFCD